jgi:hypothetical protein
MVWDTPFPGCRAIPGAAISTYRAHRYTPVPSVGSAPNLAQLDLAVPPTPDRHPTKRASDGPAPRSQDIWSTRGYAEASKLVFGELLLWSAEEPWKVWCFIQNSRHSSTAEPLQLAPALFPHDLDCEATYNALIAIAFSNGLPRVGRWL